MSSTALATGGGIASLNGQASANQTLSILVNGLETMASANGAHVANITTAALSSIAASNVVVSPAGSVVSINAQAAIQELDADMNSIPDLATWYANQLL
jgi:hypothetical protein